MMDPLIWVVSDFPRLPRVIFGDFLPGYNRTGLSPALLPAHIERRVGDAVAERLRFEKPHAYVERIVRRKYLAPIEPKRGGRAPTAPLAIVEGCRYGFDIIAAMISQEFEFHQPTYRQQD